MDIYAKLQDDILVLSPRKVIKDGFVITNPGPDILMSLGYKPLKYDERPEIQTPGNALKEVYTDQEDYIQVSYQEYTPDPAVKPVFVSNEEIEQMKKFVEYSVNTVELSDTQSLSIKELYPKWESFIGQKLSTGQKVQYQESLFKVKQDISVVLANQAPSTLTAALYEEINETAAGTKEDPIPYNGNMELFEGKYYKQNGVIYLCTRNTEQPVYHDLSALVNIYVQVAN